MTDYGHELRFGTFVTPAADRPDRTVGLAVLSEQLGYDLVTFQDHPYQPRFLDTWTLLSWVAARTTTVRLAAGVTNLPLRPPAVLARAVASLDRLSGGRVELGLGAGGFWDAIEAMGGRRLAPAEAVRAVEEAIDVVRQSWDAGAPGGVKVDGEVYRVVGAKRGPAPAHDVEIWLGAVKPRMLRLIGRLGDGWLPTLGYVTPGDLVAGNLVIDEAAEQAGRSPAAVRRLLNVSGSFLPVGRGQLEGPPEQWAEELAELAVTAGTSTFVVASDDETDLRRFAAEVAPAVRDLVAAERAGPATGGARGPATGEPRGPVTQVAREPFTLTPTPDDGARRSDVRVWDETTRPDPPEPDARRTYTADELARARRLVEVHDGLRAELAQIHDLVEQVAAGMAHPSAARSAINAMTVRQNKWTLGTYCESYCRIVTTHHTLEDAGLFPHLRSADPRLQPVVDRLAEEHVAIHGVLDRVDRALVQFVSVPDGTAELRAAVDLLGDVLLSHLAYEERVLLEPIARLGTG